MVLQVRRQATIHLLPGDSPAPAALAGAAEAEARAEAQEAQGPPGDRVAVADQVLAQGLRDRARPAADPLS